MVKYLLRGDFMAVGIICEYNPFHNGHVYHIKKIKELYPNDPIILVMSGNFTQRGEVSLLDKWAKTKIALNYVDLVVELPFIFSVQAADVFAKAAVTILKNLKVDKIIFGTESLDSEKLNEIAEIQKQKKYNTLVKEYLDKGYNYPTSMSKAVYDLSKIKIENPNDLLGLSYVKNLDSTIKAITIKRTNDFHSKDLTNKITSATSIRLALKNKKNIKKYVPKETYENLKKLHFNDDYFKFLKYKIISEIDNLNTYLNVDEGIENRIKKYIFEATDLQQLISKIKTKRYTYNKINRMLTSILCGLTKEMANKYKNPEYIRILGFNKNGSSYLKKIKKDCKLPIITKFTNKYETLNLELKTTYIYNLNEKDKIDLTLMEYKNKPIIK